MYSEAVSGVKISTILADRTVSQILDTLKRISVYWRVILPSASSPGFHRWFV
jgi:hypothetical protein